ncbi:MAG: hypothetical protein QMD10_12605, partial [Desulfitobacteriaceae bacterium]|nr:hypothetical protein [Desulfitobacteriaceae bacterium]
MQTCPRCGADNRDDRASCWNCFGQLAKPAMGGRSKQPPEVVEPDVAVIFPAVPPGKAVAEETAQATEEALTGEAMPEEIELSAPFVSDVGEEAEPSLTTEPESIDLTEEAQPE